MVDVTLITNLTLTTTLIVDDDVSSEAAAGPLRLLLLSRHHLPRRRRRRRLSATPFRVLQARSGPTSLSRGAAYRGQ